MSYVDRLTDERLYVRYSRNCVYVTDAVERRCDAGTSPQTQRRLQEPKTMRDSVLRQKKDQLLTPVARQLFAKIHPTTLSWISLGVGLLSVAAIVDRMYWIGLVLWLGNRTLDGLDGLVARIYDKQTDLGGYIDLALDFVIYLTVPIAFVFINSTQANLWALVFLFTAYVINLLSWTTLSAILEKRRVGAGGHLTSIEMPAGLVEGAETIVFYTLFYLLPDYIAYLFVIMGALVLFTASQRIWWAYRNLN